MNNILIKVENLVKTFGGLVALNDCSLEIKDKAITGIIGPNGSGKTTLFNVITGNLKPDTGKVFYNGVEITNEESHDLFHLGVLRTFQIAHEFSNMTVIENLMVVPGNQKGEKLLYSLMNSQKIKKEDELIKDKAMEVLKFLKMFTDLSLKEIDNVKGKNINELKILLANKTTDEICKYIGAKTLTFLSIDGLYRAIGFDKRNDTYPQLTDHYFTGDYPVKPVDELGDNKITQLSLLSSASNN